MIELHFFCVPLSDFFLLQLLKLSARVYIFDQRRVIKLGMGFVSLLLLF